MPPKDQPRPAEEPVIDTSAFEAELFWHKNGKTIIAAVCVVVVAALAIGFWFLNAHQAREEAARQFAVATDAASWQSVIDRFPKTEPAADAYFLVAQAKRSSGDLPGSTKAYEDFLAAFPNHPLTGGAKLGLAANLEVQGKIPEALTALQELQAQNTGSYAIPFASLLEGRILMQQGRMEEARKVFKNLLQTYPSSPAASFGSSLLHEVDTVLPPEATVTSGPTPPKPQ